MDVRLNALHRGMPVEKADLLLVLLHGHGVRGDDLVGFIDDLLVQISGGFPNTAALLPEGPLVSGLGRGWWDMSEDMNIREASAWSPPKDLVWQLVCMVKAALALCPTQPMLVLGGFSAGAAVATHGVAALRLEGVETIGLAVLSGPVDAVTACASADYMSAKVANKFFVFMAHGREDQVIPEAAVREAISWIEGAGEASARGISLDTHFHDGGHEVGNGTLEAMSTWLQAVVGTAQRQTVVDHDLPWQSARAPTLRKRQTFGTILAEHRACGSRSDLAAGAESLAVDRSGQDLSCCKSVVVDDKSMSSSPLLVGDIVRLRGAKDFPHLEGARAVLKNWDSLLQQWDVEVVSTQERTFVVPANLERLTPEEERKVVSSSAWRPVTERELSALRDTEIETVYDHPQLLGYVWGKTVVTMPQGCEYAQLGGVPCALFGRNATGAAGTPIVLFFKGHSEACALLEAMVDAYVKGLGAQVVVPFCSPKLSRCFASARAVATALPRVFGPGPLLVHGDNTGSILAIQIAAELSHPGMLPRVWLLVLENAPPSLNWVPGVQGMLGCMSGDPLTLQSRLRLVRCPVVLVRGFEGSLPGAAGQKEPMDILAAACDTPATALRAASVLDEGGGLCAEVQAAAVQALAQAGLASRRWVVESASCLVREGAGLKSPELGRLQAGALLEQLEQQGMRLRVRRLEGEGPAEGW
eukprot:CAMPEP_0179010518 /NCGR_PEP_ID=MMETSP0796-20121207/156_1 /TAXON_ID=73915 /ORGANISM="Pyrodinium bahamense, Strain pbaha01" /LENGTH=699 /DNA_ID=CAMNT_0020705801 /DNA_START=117 /DNA_END=2213 /DNA_ORIENTATION=+